MLRLIYQQTPWPLLSLKAESKGLIRFLQTCTSMCTINFNINNASVFKYDLFSINFQILPTNKSIFPESKMVIELVLADIQKSVKNNPWVLKDIIGFAKFNQALS